MAAALLIAVAVFWLLAAAAVFALSGDPGTARTLVAVAGVAILAGVELFAAERRSPGR
jgi:hypothetical protein